MQVDVLEMIHSINCPTETLYTKLHQFFLPLVYDGIVPVKCCALKQPYFFHAMSSTYTPYIALLFLVLDPRGLGGG